MMSRLITRLCYLLTTTMMAALKQTMLWVMLCLYASHSAQAFLGPDIYIGPVPNVASKHGYVMARAVVLDPATQQPILVTYNSDGSEAGVVSVGGSYQIDELTIMSAAAYHAEQQRLKMYQLQYQDTLAKGAKLMSRSAFLSNTFIAADNTTALPKPSLPNHINSVLVRGQSDRLSADASQLVLLSFSFDMTSSTNAKVADDSVSLVVSPTGNILAQSTQNIGYRTGFYGDPNKAQQGTSSGDVDKGDTVFGPVPFVKTYVDEYAYPGSVAVTDKNGQYSFLFYMPPCPIGGFEFKTDVWSELKYTNFLPTGSAALSYFLRTPGYSSCFAGLVPALLVADTISTLASISKPSYQTNLYADVMFLTGVMYLSNQQGKDVPLGETTHTAFIEQASDRLQRFYDFNGDGQADKVVRGHLKKVTDAGVEKKVFEANAEGNVQGLYFQAPENSQSPDLPPDLIRVIDQEVRTASVGILESISTADLRNTDVLFFRESTGQLIMERKGLKEAEVKGGEVELDEAKQLVGYRVMLRGPQDWSLNIGAGVRCFSR
jgi:hypothetical protein